MRCERRSSRESSGTSWKLHTVFGEYTEVECPERLSYTWTWEDGGEELAGSDGTVVVVEFREDGDGTEVVLTHRGFADERLRGMHEHGWHACLANLERRVFPAAATSA